MKKTAKKTAKKGVKSFAVQAYPAVFDLDEQGYYNVWFPDFPGCVTFGKTFEEAKKMAAEALTVWLEEMQGRGMIVNRFSSPVVTEIRPVTTV